MPLYARVVKGKVRGEIRSCPRNFRNIAEFRSLPDSEKIKYGWYPFKTDRPSFNKDLQEVVDIVYTINEDSVTAEYTVSDKDLSDLKAKYVTKLKKEAEEKCLDEVPGYKQRSAALGRYTDTKKNLVIAAVNDHADRCDNAEVNINAATNGEEVIAAYEAWLNG